MLYNYIITALRNLKRHKLYSLINISGLAVGLAVFILAVTFFSFHLSFDNFHKDPQKIFLVISETNSPAGIRQKSESTFLPLANIMLQKFPEIESAVTFRKYFRQIFRYQDKKFYETNVLFTEPGFFNVFNFKIVKGDSKTPLSKPNSVVLTESAAEKYFGHEDPIGKVLNAEYDHGSVISDLIVSAVVEECPLNSSFKFDILTSLPTNYKENWNTGGSTFTFIKLKSKTDLSNLESKLPSFTERFVPVFKESRERLLLFPMKDIHLKSIEFNSGFNVAPMILFYLILGIAAGLLIIIAINFVVLSTSRFSNRSKEVGIRKVIGAYKGQLIKQYIGESVLLSLMALPFGILLFELMRPAFISIMGGVELDLWGNPFIFLIIVGVTIFVGFTSGIYPAFFISSLLPTLILKNQSAVKKGRFSLRKALVIFQFALSFTMIAFTLTSMNQLELMSETNLGYNRGNIITLSVNNDFYKKFDVIEKELKQNPDISIVGAAHVLPFSWGRQEKMRPGEVDKNSSEILFSYPCSYNFIEALEIKILKGRSFSRNFNEENSVIISEETAKHFGWDAPIGKEIVFDERGGEKKTVIGVAKYFHFPHVIFEKAPAVIYFLPQEPFYLYIKTIKKPDDNLIKFVRETWNKIIPDLPFEYSILDYAFEENLRATIKTLDIFKFISIVSVFIACLGLFALSSYTVERRTKEIGIRKVLGASINKITGRLISEFLLLVMISDIIAIPLAYYASNYFINLGWVYKTELNFSLFALTFFVSIITALLAVGIQSYKAASVNPIESLKYE